MSQDYAINLLSIVDQDNPDNALAINFTGQAMANVKIGDDRLGPGLGRFANISVDRYLTIQTFGSTLMAESFPNSTIDIVNRWTETIVGSASQSVVNSALLLNVTTGATDSIEEYYNQELQEIPGAFARFRTGFKTGTTIEANNVREFGMIDAVKTNGVFFRFDGATLTLVTRLNGVETLNPLTNPGLTFHLYAIEVLGAGKVFAFIDDALVLETQITVGSVIGNQIRTPFMKMYNTGVLAGVPTPSEHHWVHVVDLSGSALTFQGRDDFGFFHDIAVNPSRRMLVSQEPPTPPPATLAVVATEFSDMSGTVDTIIPITDTKILTLQRFAGGAEVDGPAGNVIELFDDPNGDLSVLNVIDVIFASGNSDQHDLNAPFIGDGTRRIILRRRRLGGGAREIFARVEGFETT